MLLISSQNLLDLAIPFSVLFATLFVGLILRKFIFNKLTVWAQNTKAQLDDILITSIKAPSVIWLLMVAIYLGLECSKLPENVITFIGKLLVALGLLSLTIALSNVSSQLIKTYSTKLDAVSSNTSLIQNISKLVIFGTGVLVILNSLGVSITPILATLGVEGWRLVGSPGHAVEPLCRPHINLNKLVRVGDYVKMDSGEEGYVTDVNWRTTKIRMLSNNVILVPNAKLAQANITNYYYPEKDMAVLVNVGVHYKSNLNM